MNAKVLVCCHKKDICATGEVFLPIQVGKELSSVDLGIDCDNTGDNISSKNPNYCELTGLYWAWKNMKNVDVIGLCHYRRYFDFHNQCRVGFPLQELDTDKFDNVDLTIPHKIIDNLQDNEIILPRPISELPEYLIYCVCHNCEDLKVLKNVIRERCDIASIDAYHKVMASTELSVGNMFILRKDMFYKYCSWLFPILFEVENRIDISSYSVYQKRIYGFMAERLLNVFVEKEGLKKMYYPILSFNEAKAFDYDNITPFQYQLRRLRNLIVSKLINVDVLM